MKMIIALVIASNGFQQTEYFDTKKVLENAGLSIITVSDDHGVATAVDGSTAKIDMTIKELSGHLEELDGLFFIGGSGALDNLDTPESHALLRAFEKSSKPYGAICVSPRILARAGVLHDTQATGWDGDGKLSVIFKEYGVIYVKQPVVTDVNIVTADGPAHARDFGQAIANLYHIPVEEENL